MSDSGYIVKGITKDTIHLRLALQIYIKTNNMEETIKRLQTLADRATKYNYPEGSNMAVRISDIRAVLEFYKSTIKESGLTEDEFNNGGYTDSELNCKGCMGPCGQCKDEPPKNTNRITPDWHNLDKKYNWVAVGPDGIELAFIRKPHLYYDYMNQQNSWTGRVCVSTGRIFEMDNIDWMETLSKRPAK